MSMSEEAPRTRTFWQTLMDDKYLPWVLVSPLCLMLVIFMFYPMFYCIYMSFTNYILKKPPQFIGFENYREVLHDPVFWSAFGRTAYLSVICIIVELVLGLAIALLLNRNFKGQNLIRGACFMPLLISPLAMSLMWGYLLHNQYGIINRILSWFGIIGVEWFSNPSYAIYTIMFLTIWQWLPFSAFVLLAGLKGMPKDQFEAANVDGASPFFTFRKLTLPMLKPLILIIILLRTMWLIRTFDPLYGTTRGGLDTELLDWMVFRVAFVFFDIGQGSALAIFSLYITIIVCALMFRQLMKVMDNA
ncbi:MAG: sugar ABC transporter permease [bacterium]|nr:sugar ABC transporter permease [bacterium]